jgi:hypothetical protein
MDSNRLPEEKATGPPRGAPLSNMEIHEMAQGLERLRREAATRDVRLGQLRAEIRRLQDALEHEVRLRAL